MVLLKISSYYKKILIIIGIIHRMCKYFLLDQTRIEPVFLITEKGRDVHFACATFFRDSANWTWNNGHLPRNARAFSYLNQSVLTIENVRLANAGTYECMARVPRKNKREKAYFAAPAELRVIGK